MKQNNRTIQPIYKLDENRVISLHNLYKQEWWSNNRTLKETKSIVENSSITVGLIDESNTLIAFARVLTDYTIKALIFDVIVDKSYRNRGLGKKLIQLILEHQALKNVKHFELYCLPEMVEYYKSYGFTDGLENLVFMRKG